LQQQLCFEGGEKRKPAYLVIGWFLSKGRQFTATKQRQRRTAKHHTNVLTLGAVLGLKRFLATVNG
jgi:hypothetical protein